MGPSGSGKSTLMHCVAGLDNLTSGQVFIGTTDLSRLSEKQLTLLRRDQIGFIFQSFNLVPTLTAAENITLPMDLAGRKPDPAWFDQVIIDGRPARPAQAPAERAVRWPAAARGGGAGPGQPAADHLRRRAHRQPRLPLGHEVLDFMRKAVDEFGQTIVMVTHDPNAASHADRVVFLADGKIVDEMADPTAERVLDRMKRVRRVSRPAHR